MNHIAGQPVPQAAGFQSAMWYYNDVVMNSPLQLQVAVPTVQVISAAPQSPIPTPTPAPAPAPTPTPTLSSTPSSTSTPAPPQIPAPINIIPEKSKKIKKEPQEDRERNFCCEVCGTTFTSSSNLRIHMKIHLGVRPFVCSECGKSFIQSSNLKTHKRIHTGERPYKCTECGQTFSRSSHLVGHKRIHTGERPYICGLCGVAFYTSSHMRNHVRRHTGEKPYICHFCGEAFNQSSELRVHVRHHSGEKWFKCRECHNAFFSAPELRAHCKLKHSSSKPFTCEKCERCFRTFKFFTKHNGKCTGPRPKRPKGRPPKYPRDENGESSHKKPKNLRNKKPVVPSDRISRSKTRALRIAKMKVEVEAKEEQLNNREIIPVFEQDSDILDDSGSSEFNEGSSLKDEGLPESDEHISQLPLVHVMLDNFSSGSDGLVLHSVPSDALQGTHSLTDERDEFGVMDLSGQQMHEVEHQDESDAQPPLSFLPTQSMSVVTADHQLPLVSDREEQLSLDHHQVTPTMVNQHSLINHEKLPISTTFQQSVSSLPLSVTNSVTTAGSMTAIPQVSAHHQTVANFVGQVTPNPHSHSHQQQLSVVPAHQHSSSVTTPHQVPAVTAHQHLPSVTSIHSASSSHLQLPTINAHQGQLGVCVHQQAAPLSNNLENTVTAHQNLNLTIASNHQQISTTSAHHMLPVVSAHQQQQLSTLPTQQLSTTANTQLSTGVSHHHVMNSHHQLPVVSAHQQAVSNLQLPSVSSRHALPTILTAHQGSSAVQQQQQQMVAVTAHQPVSSVLQQHLPAITAHQQIASATDQQIATAHFPSNPAVVSGVHPQSLLVTAHQQHVVPFLPVYKHSCNLGSTEDTSQVLYEGGQSFVVDLSSPALTQQVTLVDHTVTSHSTSH